MSSKRSRPLGPIKDPFLRKILRALEEVQLDPALFERAMGDLLHDAFPGLSPVPGGGDQGFDASIADGKGEPYPLVCTTAEDVEGNLRKSLKSYLKNGWSTPKAALATSRRLNPGQRKKLRNIAREEGITLMQIFGRDALADRLARNARWCVELLGLPFQVSPLAGMPRSWRPLLEIPLVGRDKDVEWLLKTSGDRILVGEPGSGKTFLFYRLIRHRRWPALFLTGVEKSDDEIARALHDLRPKIVLLDDAHTELELLKRLLHLRSRGLVPPFDLVASTWRGGASRVALDLGGLPAACIRQLEMLARDEIVQVMRSVGLDVNDDLMRYLVDQASNRPGLAVTIASRALQGDWKDVISGEFLAQDLLAFFESSSGPEVRQVLAGLSIGGDRGMAWEDVADFLGLGKAQAQRIVTDLAAGGILREIEPERGVLAVWPRVFRSALLRSVFFSGGTSRSFRKLLDKAPSCQKAVEAILSAIDGDLPLDRYGIRALVMQAGSIRAWNQLAALNKEQAEWVLENYPEDVRDVAGGALLKAPDLTIQRILDASDAEVKAGEEERSEPFVLLARWVEDLVGLKGDPQRAIDRRRALAIAARDFLESGLSPGLGLRAILLALSPKLRNSSLDPGIGLTVSFRVELLPVEYVEQLTSLWDLSKGAVREIDAEGWSHLASANWDWSDPQSAMMGEVGEPLRLALHNLGERVLQDLAPLCRSSPGLSAGFLELATRLGVDLPVERDPAFDAIFPSLFGRPQRWLEPSMLIVSHRALELAESWIDFGPLEVSRRFAFYLSEGQRIGKGGSSNLERISWYLAWNSESRLPWLEAFVGKGLEGAFVRPFLAIATEKEEAGWAAALTKCFETPRLTRVAFGVALASAALSKDLLARVLAVAADHPDEVFSVSGGRKIPVSTLRALLQHNSVEVALAAAIGEWTAEQRGFVRPEIAAEWRQAMIRPTSRVVGIGGLQEAILLSDPNLGTSWLMEHLDAAQRDPEFIGNQSLAVTVAHSLPRAGRTDFLRIQISDNELSFELVPALVGGDPDLFRALLENPTGVVLHRRGLAREPDELWAELVKVAIEKRMPVDDILRGSVSRSGIWGGSAISDIEARDAQLVHFEHHPNPGVRGVVGKLRKLNSSHLGQALAMDKGIQLFGSFDLE